MTTKQIETLTRELEEHLRQLTDRRDHAAIYFATADETMQTHVKHLYARVRELEDAVEAFSTVEWRTTNGA